MMDQINDWINSTRNPDLTRAIIVVAIFAVMICLDKIARKRIEQIKDRDHT